MNDKLAKKINDFFSHFTLRKIKKGEVLIRAGEDPKGIIYLTKGNIKKYAISSKGDEHIINIFKPTSFLPMSWAINNTRNDYFYEAMTDGEVTIAPREQIIEFIKSNKDVLFDLMSRVFKGTDGMEKKMVYLMTGSAYDKLIIELILQAKRFGVKSIDGIGIELKIKEADLAAESGMTRETVSREIKLLKDKGLVTLEKSKLVINNLRKLESELTE